MHLRWQRAGVQLGLLPVMPLRVTRASARNELLTDAVPDQSAWRAARAQQVLLQPLPLVLDLLFEAKQLAVCEAAQAHMCDG